MSTRKTKPLTFLFDDDGYVPNNPKLPFVVYRGAVDLAGTPDPEELVEKVISGNGWGEIWRNGIYEYVHYHSMIHEALGIARGRAKVRFGGKQGRGAGNRRRRRRHPARRHRTSMPVGVARSDGDRRLSRRAGNSTSAAAARPSTPKRSSAIPKVPMPDTDPVYGKHGPLLTLWRGVTQSFYNPTVTGRA